MATIKTIFSKRDAKRLVDTLADINRALPLIDDAESCGIECQALRNQLEERRQTLENIRAKFMNPNGRKPK